MILFRKQREAIGNYFLSRQLKRQSRQIEMTRLDQMQEAGIFFDASSESTRKEVKAQIKKLNEKNIKVKALGFFDHRKPEDNFISDKTVYFATLNDFSFFFLPKSPEVKEFISNTPDALFIYSAQNSFPGKVVNALSMAKLKVGFTGVFNNIPDITFEIPECEPKQLTEQIEKYLQ